MSPSPLVLGVVAQVSPLLVRRKGSTVNVAVQRHLAPTDGLAVGDRVVLAVVDRQLTYMGQWGAAPPSGGAGHVHTGSFKSPAETVTGDWNNVIESGIYKGFDLANQSPGWNLTWRRVLVIQHSSSYVSQVSFSYSADGGKGATVYHRALDNGNWRPWMPLDVGQNTGWINVSTFANGWVNYGGIYPVARYRKLATGMVRLSGLIKNGTLNAHAFTLPATYRPSTDLHMATISNNAFARVVVRGNGQVSIDTPGSNTWCSLDGLAMFLAEQ